MEVGKYVDGRVLTFDQEKQAFAIGGTPVTIQQVQEYDRFGQISWVSNEWQSWTQGLTHPETQAAAAEESNDQFKSLKWWHVLLGLVSLPFTILYLMYLMWRRRLFSKNARIALSVAGSIMALGLLFFGLPRAGTVPVDERPSGSAEKQQAPTKESTAPAEPESEPERTFSAVTVTRVVDGDTAEMTYEDGKVERVRFIGVDCPESTNEVEPYGEQASAYTKHELDGKTVYLETDAELRDKYDRLLAYVWLEKPSAKPNKAEIRDYLFNAHLLLEGFAQLLTIPPNVMYVEAFKEFQTEARNEHTGLWAPEPEPVPEPKPEPEPSPTPDAAYIANSNTGKFHHSWCRYVDEMKAEHRVPYSSREAAREDGYVPCKVCDP